MEAPIIAQTLVHWCAKRPCTTGVSHLGRSGSNSPPVRRNSPGATRVPPCRCSTGAVFHGYSCYSQDDTASCRKITGRCGAARLRPEGFPWLRNPPSGALPEQAARTHTTNTSATGRVARISAGVDEKNIEITPSLVESPPALPRQSCPASPQLLPPPLVIRHDPRNRLPVVAAVAAVPQMHELVHDDVVDQVHRGLDDVKSGGRRPADIRGAHRRECRTRSRNARHVGRWSRRLHPRTGRRGRRGASVAPRCRSGRCRGRPREARDEIRLLPAGIIELEHPAQHLEAVSRERLQHLS